MSAAAIPKFSPSVVAEAIGPREHFDALHGQHTSNVAYLAIPTKGYPHERTFPPEETRFVMEMAPALDGMDLYFSQNGFHHRRRVAQVAALTALWVDLDFYKDPRLKRANPLGLLNGVQARYPGLPTPTLVISSGRGGYFEWVFDQPLPPSALPQWQHTMDGLIAMLKDFGADPACRDATRVLRIVGGTNQKNGREVVGYRTGTPVRFDEMRRAVLGYAGTKTVRAIEAQAAKPPAPKGNNATPATQAPAIKEPRPTKQLPEKQAKALLGPYLLHRARLRDYETLARMRGGKLKDCRARMLFAVAASLAWFIGDEARLRVELEDFAQEHFQNPQRYGLGRVGAVVDRLKLDQGGVVIPVHEGERVPNRYRMTNAYLLKLLGISPEEERAMATIISPEEKARRRRERTGAMSREAYEAQAQEKRERISALSADGLSQAEIARAIGMHRQQVHRTLKAGAAAEYKEHTFYMNHPSADRSRRIIELAASGLSQRAIAAELGVSQSTVLRALRRGKP